MTPEQEPQSKPPTLEEIVRLAKETTLEDGSHAPTIIAYGSRSSVAVQLVDFPATHEEKMHLLFATGYVLGESGTVGILTEMFFIAEGWWSQADSDQSIAVRPSQDPQRKEVLVIHHYKVEEHETHAVALEMLRDGEGRLRELKALASYPPAPKTRVDSPLISAFVVGFRLGVGGKVN